MLKSVSRKCLGTYQISPKDSPERSTRMQIHGTALTSDECSRDYYRGEGSLRNYNTMEEFRTVDKAKLIERAGKTIWDAINDGTLYSCPSLLSSFAAISYADLKKYKFTYHFAYPAIHSDPQWRLLVAEEGKPETGTKQLGSRETTALVDRVQTWKYSVDSRQHGFFLAKRIPKHILDWQRRNSGEKEVEDGNLHRPKTPKTPTIDELGFAWDVGSLASYEEGFFDKIDREDRFVCFADPSTYPHNPGWMLRNLLILVRQRWKLDKVQVICYRDTHARREHPTSLIMQLQSAIPVYFTKSPQLDMPPMGNSSALLPDQVDRFGELIVQKPVDPPPQQSKAQPEQPKSEDVPSKPLALPKVTGWERNDNNKIISRTVDLAAYMDPTRLADQAVDLNLKLIKWRISPSIDLEKIKYTSCLLLGAGTLGSYISRTLLGWGVRKITFVDNARVSYSNPVRQPLYDFRDCQDGGARKAERAADVLTEIYPGVDANGYHMSVPMAGHPIVEEERTQKDYERLKRLIDDHDAVFLLMDTRESRWLPTVMAKAAGKIVINVAIGFDTYVVMRQGLEPTKQSLKKNEATEKPLNEGEEEVMSSKQTHLIPLSTPTTEGTTPQPAIDTETQGPQQQEEEELGCYFCTDVVAPADSLKSATLDQQCTVTRPGTAPLASALAVELFVSLTQHRLGARAPAPAPPPPSTHMNQILPAPPTDPAVPNSHPLGTIPHTMRGYMSTWQTIQVSGRAYDCCSACSPEILKRYREEDWSFVKRALSEKGYVEEVCGLAEVQRKAEEADALIEWDEDDEEAELL
ncbi:hypothetical protein K431DRAFT_156013 [Polychaeton citri CBS 116435]|uniref:Ubiquitin-like modifier-activating enzyme ATG7 n=1 Tax=Polychaeton citri CBS 116435 TaxID=1314669 RepID=A0A9P4UT32_9PEZI|nr:hypothetical protein K431DRAFT_156013 [Polychaeton citri CBS 116435]